MKLSYIHECNICDIQIDEGFRDKLKAAALGAGIAAGGIFGGQMLEPSSQQQQQTQSQEQQVQDGVTVEGDTIIVRASDKRWEDSQTKAYDMLAKQGGEGVNLTATGYQGQLPVGVEQRTVKGKDGLWHTTLKLSKSGQAQAAQGRSEMGSSSIIQRYDGRVAPRSGGSLNPRDL